MGWGTAWSAALLLGASIGEALFLRQPLLAALAGDRRPGFLPAPVFALACILGIAVCFAARVPLPFHYLFLYACTILWFNGAYRASRARILFAANICTAHLAGAHLLCLGVLALARGSTPYQVWTSPPLYLASLNAALLLVLALTLVLQRMADARVLAAWADATLHTRGMGRFAWYALAYTLFDTIPCLFDLPYALISWFLIGSCLLLTAQWYIFLVYAYRISLRQHWEHEFRTLERQRAAQVRKSLELRHIATIDAVTGAYTRAYVLHLLRQWLRDGKRFSLAYIDLDGLKAVNDLHGHDAGDAYLAAAGEALNSRLQARDVLARIGGDEFLVLLPDTPEAEAGARIRAAGRALENGAGQYPHSFSYGVIEAPTARKAPPGDGPDRSDASLDAAVDDLLRQADARMYENKVERRSAREMMP